MTETKDTESTAKVKKSTAKPKAAAKAPAAKKTTTSAKKPAARKTKATSASPEHHYRMVEVAAYYLAEKDGFAGNPIDYWIAAELQINSQ